MTRDFERLAHPVASFDEQGPETPNDLVMRRLCRVRMNIDPKLQLLKVPVRSKVPDGSTRGQWGKLLRANTQHRYSRSDWSR